MPATEALVEAPRQVRSKIRVVDGDIHNGAPNLRKYIAEPWKTLGIPMHGHLGYLNPAGVTRKDTIDEKGVCAASSVEGIARMLLDPYGIDIGILTGGTYAACNHPDPDFAAAVCKAYNDCIIEEWLPKDERLRMAMVIPAQDPQAAAAEIERIGRHPKIVEVIVSSASNRPYGQRFYHPIYEACAKLDLPIAMHPGNEGCGTSLGPTAVGFPTKYIEWHTGISQAAQSHVVSFVTEGVFAKFPTLKVVLIECGVSWLAPLMWRFDKNWKALRSTVPWVDRKPSEIIQEHFLLTTQPIEEPDNHEHLKQLFGMFDAENMLMFSSDFPHWDGDTPDFALRGFSDQFKRRVLAENAIELYGL